MNFLFLFSVALLSASECIFYDKMVHFYILNPFLLHYEKLDSFEHKDI